MSQIAQANSFWSATVQEHPCIKASAPLTHYSRHSDNMLLLSIRSAQVAVTTVGTRQNLS